MGKRTWPKSRRRWYFLGGLLVVFMLAWIFRVPILTGYANWFIKDNATKGADAIIILSGGRMTRVPKGLELWSKGYAPLLCLTASKPLNAKYRHLHRSNFEFARAVVREADLNATFTVIPSLGDGATSTFDEAADALAFSKERKWTRIIIVTDGFHTRRALLAFEKVFDDSGIEVQAAAVPNDIFDATNWWTSDRGISSFVLETVKYPVYFFWSEEPTVVRND
jgi:uncharacterized SAM-binding protein YcdF (DUF218 family)